MRLERFTDAAQFYGRVEAFLLCHEAHHNLLFGILAGLKEKPNAQAYFALVEDGDICAVAVRTPPHNLVLSLTSDKNALGLLVKDVQEVSPDLSGVLGLTDDAAAFAELWKAETGQPYTLGMRQCIYCSSTIQGVTGVKGSLRRAEERDRLLLVDWLAAFSEEALGGTERGEAERLADAFLRGSGKNIYLWEDDEAVSMAGYNGPTPHGIRVSAVYTPPEHRGRGYARACTAALSQILLDSYQFCFLFTDRANATSNYIYQQIGYKPVCDVNEYRFR